MQGMKSTIKETIQIIVFPLLFLSLLFFLFFDWLILVVADTSIKHIQYLKCETSQLPFQMPILTVH